MLNRLKRQTVGFEKSVPDGVRVVQSHNVSPWGVVNMRIVSPVVAAASFPFPAECSQVARQMTFLIGVLATTD